jgi:hypothetical protein
MQRKALKKDKSHAKTWPHRYAKRCSLGMRAWRKGAKGQKIEQKDEPRIRASAPT